MQTPYEILSVSTEANDAEIKKAYLQKVKNHSPDRDQEKFQMIHNAYQSIKDRKGRMSYELFNNQECDFEQLTDRALDPVETAQVKPEHLLMLLRVSIDETTARNALIKMVE